MCLPASPRWQQPRRASAARNTLDARRGLAGAALVARRDEDEARVLAAFDAPTCDRAARALARAGESNVPTLVLDYVESKTDDAET